MAKTEPAITETVPVFIPKESKNDDALYVCVNGKSAMIRKGETVYVKRQFAEVIENSARMSKEAERYIEANRKD